MHENVSGFGAAGKEGEEQPPIQPHETELDYYYRSYSARRSFNVHHPPWGILQVDENQFASMLVGGSIIANAILEDYTSMARREEETIQRREKAEALMKNAQAAEERLEKQKAEFETLKKTEEWVASSGLKQELNNLKAVNTTLVKEKTAAEADAKEAEARSAATLKEAEVRVAVKELKDANADRSKLSKAIEGSPVKTRETILGDVTLRATEAKARARQAEEDRDGLATSIAQLTSDRAWMRQFGIGHIVEAILDAPENTAVVADVNECMCQAGFKAGYN
ncbi:hypothetical protein HanXRQr2_Chr16g0755231 [Helianthus annuus]|uniref:Uncharacterized protein n=1 Tax=Helianthus annuus TaxID=4232 RepID=A0A9K3GZ72_HELAN|nr:hypothetical protein HanXRQr2_Chr16g0755231 [Helianthus annuus]KAJ0443432.1 hypothetical protein HanIR_Chr16g0820671 [Helianthus annuus]